jgi:putative DNA primase/helicase
MAHSPEYLFFDKIPVDYVEGVDCPVIKQFLRSILNKKDVALIQEFAGYLLWRSYLIKKAFILIGERDTGKTTLLNLLIKFIGELNTSGVSLQKLTSDKFSAANLYHKHLNAHDDLSINDVNDNGSFKMATGGGYISGEYKFGNRFDFKNFAKLVFACNQIPTAKQTDDDAYFGRWIVVRFEKEIRKKKPFLLEQMTTSQELSGFLNFALSGLGRLLKNGKFTYDKEPDEIRDEMMRSGSAIASFVAEGIAFEPDAWISKTDMYQVFKYYATQKRGMVMTKTSFGKKICKLAPYIKSGKKKVLKQVTGWRNVKITNSDLLNQVNMADIPESPTARNTITPELGREDIIDSTLFK